MKLSVVFVSSIALACFTVSALSSEQAISVNLTINSAIPASNFAGAITLLDKTKQPQTEPFHSKNYDPSRPAEFGDNVNDLVLYQQQGYSYIQLKLAQINGSDVASPSCTTRSFAIADLLKTPVVLNMTAKAHNKDWYCVIDNVTS